MNQKTYELLPFNFPSILKDTTPKEQVLCFEQSLAPSGVKAKTIFLELVRFNFNPYGLSKIECV
jgi:hypothetical protein